MMVALVTGFRYRGHMDVYRKGCEFDACHAVVDEVEPVVMSALTVDGSTLTTVVHACTEHRARMAAPALAHTSR